MLFVLCAATGPLAGCMTNGIGFSTFAQPDRDVITGSIGDYPALQSDDDIIKTTVAEANVKQGSLQNIPWSNIATGNGGIVSYVGERRSVTEICREFLASKHSYDGISQYHGKICRTRMGKSWTLQSIEKQG